MSFDKSTNETFKTRGLKKGEEVKKNAEWSCRITVISLDVCALSPSKTYRLIYQSLLVTSDFIEYRTTQRGRETRMMGVHS